MSVKRAFPDPFRHRNPLEFASIPTVTKAEYAALDETEPEDELVSIVAFSDKLTPGYVTKRSILCRSPTFAAFFASEHYVPNAKFCLWMMEDEAFVVQTALRYLWEQEEFELPAMDRYNIVGKVQFSIRLYFLAKRLQLPDLENMAYSMLGQFEGDMRAEVITDLAEVIYKKPTEEDCRVRGFLQRQVEMNLRELLNYVAWRELLRGPSSTLAADMFEFISTLLLEGHADENYPPQLAPPGRDMPLPEHRDERICAVAVRKYPPTAPDDQACHRGERLIPCDVFDDEVVGFDNKGQRRVIPRDYVHLQIEKERSLFSWFEEVARVREKKKNYTTRKRQVGNATHHKTDWLLGTGEWSEGPYAASLKTPFSPTEDANPDTSFASSMASVGSSIKRRLSVGSGHGNRRWSLTSGSDGRRFSVASGHDSRRCSVASGQDSRRFSVASGQDTRRSSILGGHNRRRSVAF